MLNNKTDKINKNTVMLLFIFIALFYLPPIFNKDYLGIIVILFTFIFLIFKCIPYTNNSNYILLYIIYTSCVDLFTLMYTENSLYYILRILLYSFLPLIAFSVGVYFKKKITIPVFENVLLFIGFMQIIIGILQQISPVFREYTLLKYANYEKYAEPFTYNLIGRIVGTIGNPNTFGVFVSIIIILAYINLFNKNNLHYYKNICLMCIILLGVLSLIFSISRTGIIVFFLGILICIFGGQQKITKNVLYLFPILLVFYNLLSLIPNRFAMEGLMTIGSRTDTWSFYLINYNYNYIFNTLFGYGMIINYLNEPVPDNLYLELLLKYGIIGVILYVNVFINFILKLLNKKVLFPAVMLIMIFVADITGAVNLHPDLLIFYFLIIGYYI